MKPPPIVLVLGALALTRCDGGCGSEGGAPAASSASPSATTTTTSAAETKAAPASLCRRLAADDTLELARLTHGDVMAFATPSLDAAAPTDLSAVLAAARALGAASASTSVSGEGWVFHDGAMVPRAIAGLAPEAARALIPHLSSGRFAEREGEVVLTGADAHRLGLELGEQVVVAVATGDEVASAKQKVVGLMRAEGVLGGDQAGLWMTASAAEALFPSHDEHVTTARIALPSDTDRAKWSERLTERVGRDVRVLTHEELQAGLLAAAVELDGMCREAAKAPRAPVRARAELSCAHLHEEGVAGASMLADLLGDVAIPPSPAGPPDTSWLPAEAERRTGYSFEGDAMTQAFLAPVKITGLASSSREALRKHIVEGKLEDVGTDGGAIVSQALAFELGVGVGDAITLALRPAGTDGALRSANVTIRALVGPVRDPLLSLRDMVLLDRDHAASLDSRSDQAAWLFVRTGPGKASAVMSAAPAGVTVRDLRRSFADASSAAQRVLAALCNAADETRPE